MDSKTHRHISKVAIDNLGINELNKNKEGILFYSVQPDLDEREGLFKNHFYNPATRKNFKGERTSALTQYIKYYNLALEDIDNGMNYYEHLGRCLHYLVDLNTPVHTYYEDSFDAATRLNQHIKFERYCNDLIDEYNKLIEIENLNYYLYNSKKDIGKECARKASILFRKYDTEVNILKELREVAIDAINNCIKSSIGIIYRFTKEARNGEDIFKGINL